MRILVTGSRTWDDAKTIREALEALAASFAASGVQRMTVVHGACPNGADEVADQWVRYYRGPLAVTAERHPAKWKVFGKRAGMVRNELMVAAGADLCLAFIRDASRGATHCAELASDRGIPLRVFHYGEPGVTAMDSRHLADEDVI
ncbi:SLOG family protein [Dactylosporangium sp. CA-052675]|uniref:SLOG family protein n=1 Tax=Dactylosporangium sp. CA-052675 TaxID=3239927 RepID=UPI003D8AE236